MLKKFYLFYEKLESFYLKFPSFHFIISLFGIFFWVFAFKTSVLDANTIPTGSMIPTLKIGDLLFVNKMRYNLNLPFTDIKLIHFDIPKRGEVVTFSPPLTGMDAGDLVGKVLVKRIVGVPGDVIQVKDNYVYINEIKYSTRLAKNKKIIDDIDYPSACYPFTKDDLFLEKEIIQDSANKASKEYYIMQINPKKYPTMNLDLRTPDNMPWVIPENKYMLMGDNRDNSSDSRVFGFVDRENIHGKVYMVYFSINWNESSQCNGNKEYNALTILYDNPIAKLLKKIFGFYDGSYVRWNRIGTTIK